VKTTRSAGLALAILLGAPSAHATLGGDERSVTIDQRHFAAKREIRALEIGARHALALPSGATVHEYLSDDGRVYGVAWSGPRMPDLEQLLGKYFPQLSQRDRRRGGHHRMRVTGDDLVVQSRGHGNAFSGRAWVPSLLPAGVDPSSLSVGQ
jgi:hypothetical protein